VFNEKMDEDEFWREKGWGVIKRGSRDLRG